MRLEVASERLCIEGGGEEGRAIERARRRRLFPCHGRQHQAATPHSFLRVETYAQQLQTSHLVCGQRVVVRCFFGSVWGG